MVLHNFSTSTPDVTFPILWTFSSHKTPCLFTTDVPFLYCTLPPHTAQTSPCTADATLLVLHNYSLHTADVTFLIMETFSSAPHTQSSHCRCSPSDSVHSLYTWHNLLLVLQILPSWYCTLSLLILSM